MHHVSSKEAPRKAGKLKGTWIRPAGKRAPRATGSRHSKGLERRLEAGAHGGKPMSENDTDDNLNQQITKLNKNISRQEKELNALKMNIHRFDLELNRLLKNIERKEAEQQTNKTNKPPEF